MGREADAIQAVLAQFKRAQEAAAICRMWNSQYCRELDIEFQKRSAEAEADFSQKSLQLKRRYEESLIQAQKELQLTLQQNITTALIQSNQYLGLIAAPWNSPLWRQYKPPDPLTVPGGTRVGVFALGGPALTAEAPALVPLVGARPVLIVSHTGDLTAMNELLQAVALRLVGTFPPGSLRLVLVDPHGQGGNLADFLRLPQVIRGPKVFASAHEIDEELEQLAQHVENVIQTRLVNTYRFIEEYNGKAGEISVPYYFLLMVNLPAGLTDRGFSRLMDLARNGPRTGTFFIATVDPEAKWPHGANFEDLAQLATVLVETGPRQMTWNDTASKWPIVADAKPASKDLINQILDNVGQLAEKQAGVGLPFSRVSLDPKLRWRESSAGGLEVPVGVDGSGEVYNLKLGMDLVQHGLIGGKTNSGKTNLIHLMLLGLAEKFSPAELELYLVDLKIGVEFKDYQTYNLPHAQVIALESDRELAVSVLHHLQQEMTTRANLFRPVGAKDIGEYRLKTNLILPRILLVMDEYQMLFMPDNDTIASEANRLLIDLVKRARAFGIHVLLSSQSPASAFTSNKDVLSNMALRVSFQAEDSVARQILGADNDAARLLERPGEAIFNTGNGLPDKNVFVKVALLQHAEQRERLSQLSDLARSTHVVRTRPMLVFEGDAPVRLMENGEFRAGLSQPRWPERRSPAHAWLGEPIEFKPPTRVAFERRVHANLLIIGQDKTSGYSLLTNSLLGLAAERAPEDAEFMILDLARRDELWSNALNDTASILIQRKQTYGQRDTPAVLAELTELLGQRSDSQASLTMPDIYVIIAGLGQFSALGEKDKYDNPGQPAKDFIRILTEGPDVGFHTLAWTANYEQLDRMLRRPGTSQFGLRVALAMGADESNRYLDRPDAARLGNKNRALLRDDSGSDDSLEKFKPYDLPTPQDLQEYEPMIKRRTIS